MKRYFTSDFHLGSPKIIQWAERPFKTLDEMKEKILNACLKTSPGDLIFHLGDLASIGNDRGEKCGETIQSVSEFCEIVPAKIICLKGNHDLNNGLRPVCTSLRTSLGKRYQDVSASHYPSFSFHSKKHFRRGDIHLCGHVHQLWKYFVDKKNEVLNINVGIDAWNYELVSEDELIRYINKLISSGTGKKEEYI